MTRRSNAGKMLAGLALALGLATACGDTVNYTYVDVEVNVDTATLDATHLYLVTTCELFVSGADDSPGGTGLPCRENNVPPHVGRFQWSSRATSGALEFTVKLFDANREVLGAGTSDPVPVSPGKRLETSVLVLGIAQPDAGTPDSAGAPDAGAPDTGTTADATADSSDAGVD